MTTTGEYLLSKSTLPIGTALAHFLTMQTGGGTGQGTVFASMFTVRCDEPQLCVDLSKESKPVRQVSEAPVKPGKEVKRLFVTTREDGITITSQSNNLTVVEVKK